MVEQLVFWERDLFLLLHSPHTPFADAFMYLISARWPWYAMAVGLTIFLCYRKPWRESLLMILMVTLLIVVTDQFTSGLIKPYFCRLRPTWHPLVQDAVQLVYGQRGGGYGFVSGHAANFMAVATLTSLAFRNRWYTWLMYSVAVVIAYSRIYLGMHFITDVVPGALIGLLMGYLVYLLYIYLRRVLFGEYGTLSLKKLYAPTIHYFTFFFASFVLFLVAFSAELTHIIKHLS